MISWALINDWHVPPRLPLDAPVPVVVSLDPCFIFKTKRKLKDLVAKAIYNDLIHGTVHAKIFVRTISSHDIHTFSLTENRISAYLRGF